MAVSMTQHAPSQPTRSCFYVSIKRQDIEPALYYVMCLSCSSYHCAYDLRTQGPAVFPIRAQAEALCHSLNS